MRPELSSVARNGSTGNSGSCNRVVAKALDALAFYRIVEEEVDAHDVADAEKAGIADTITGFFTMIDETVERKGLAVFRQQAETDAQRMVGG